MISSKNADDFHQWRATREYPRPKPAPIMSEDIVFLFECYVKAVAYQVESIGEDNPDDLGQTILRVWSDEYHDGLHLVRTYLVAIRQLGEYHGMSKQDLDRFVIDVIRGKQKLVNFDYCQIRGHA